MIMDRPVVDSDEDLGGIGPTLGHGLVELGEDGHTDMTPLQEDHLTSQGIDRAEDPVDRVAAAAPAGQGLGVPGRRVRRGERWLPIEAHFIQEKEGIARRIRPGQRQAVVDV